jgi:hypothetical protein
MPDKNHYKSIIISQEVNSISSEKVRFICCYNKQISFEYQIGTINFDGKSVCIIKDIDANLTCFTLTRLSFNQKTIATW